MQSLFFATPTLILTFGSILVLLVGLWVHSNPALIGISVTTLVAAAGVYASMIGRPAQDAFAGMIVFDSFGLFFALFAIFAVFISVFISAHSSELRNDRRSEYYSILLALCTGLIFMGISNHFLMIYLAVETVSILSYTLAGFNREKSSSTEASMKYVVYGAMASAIMIYGLSLVFGITGHVDLIGLRQYISSTPVDQIPVLLWMAILFVFAGIGYKISAAPMHMWTPDVYEGAPTPVSALFSVAPKAAGFALLLRFFITGFTLPLEAGSAAVALSDDAARVSFHIVGPFDWPKFLMISSVFTMFMGNLAALGQVSVKRILAYSSIAHAGYVLMGATTQTYAGLYAVVFYMILYCLMNLGAFWVASKVEDTLGGESLRHFRGLGMQRPFYAVVMTVFLFSLVGLPPFAGFIGKLYLFSAVIAREMYGLALVAAINSVISLYFYAKIVKAMFLEKAEVVIPQGAQTPFESTTAKVFLTLLAVPNVVLVLYWEPILSLARGAIRFFTGA